MVKKYLNLTNQLDNFDESKLYINFEYTDLNGNQIEGVYQRYDDIQDLLEYFASNLVSDFHEESTVLNGINGAIDITKPITIKVIPDKK